MPISIRIAGDVRIAGIIKISYYSRQGFIRGNTIAKCKLFAK